MVGIYVCGPTVYNYIHIGTTSVNGFLELVCRQCYTTINNVNKTSKDLFGGPFHILSAIC